MTNEDSTNGSGKGLECWNGTLIAMYGTTMQKNTAAALAWVAETLSSSNYWQGIAWNGTVFCAVARTTANAATSPDGITWTTRAMPSSAEWCAIAWNGTVFCAISGPASNKAATSTDGITWSEG